MDLKDLREKIDVLDEQMLSLFIERMDVCKQVADYKKANKVSVMQGGREQEILDRVKNNSPENLKSGSAVLFQNIMDISKILQSLEISKEKELPQMSEFIPANAKKIACQGTKGSYSEKACQRLFGDKDVSFYPAFEDVFKAVENGDVEYGILPIENSTIGSVSETYDLMAKHEFYINSLIRVEITHCLAAKKGSTLDGIKSVYSKEEALSQCSEFLKENSLECRQYANTALAAEMVAKSDDFSCGCICAESCAELYGLEILSKMVADAYPNYTRFICFSKGLTTTEDADTISVCISIPHTKGSLYRVLTKFAVSGLNLMKIENKSIAGSDFEVIFYLDFNGKYSDSAVQALLTDLQGELSMFRLLGNFSELK